MKIVGYRNTNDIDVEFLDDFHYIKKHNTYNNFKKHSSEIPLALADGMNGEM